MSEVDEFERRVKRRIVGEPRQNQIIAKANRNCISFDVLDESLDSDLAGELDIGIEEVQRLKQSDADWKNSLESVYFEIHSKFGVSEEVVQRAVSAIKKLPVNFRKDLQNISTNEQVGIPLAVRHWLHGEGVLLKTHARQQSPPRTETHHEKDSMLAAPGVSSSGLAQVGPEHTLVQNIDLGSVMATDAVGGYYEFASQGSMDETEASAVLVGAHNDLCVQSDHRNSSEGQLCQEHSVSTLGDEIGQTEVRLAWIEGMRIEISSASGTRSAGTVEYLSEDIFAIAVMDDHLIKKFSTENATNVTRILGPEPEETSQSLSAVILKGAKTSRCKCGIAKMVRDYLEGPGDGSSELEAIAFASQTLKEKCSLLKFVSVLGEGGYGTVLSVESPNGNAAVKMELMRGCPEVTESPLWRELNILGDTPKQLANCVPKLKNIFSSHAFVRIWSGSHTVSLLSMELLMSLSIHTKGSLLEDGSIPDSYRHTALRQCLILDKAMAAGISHGDVKNAHFMCRPGDGTVVLLDWGLAERTKDFVYTVKAKRRRVDAKIGKLLFAPASLQTQGGASAPRRSLLRLGQSRPNTKGYRPEREVKDFNEQHQADVWALAVGWLKAVVTVPRTNYSAKQFENDLYDAARRSVDEFIQFCAHTNRPSSTDIENVGFHPSVNTWLRLIHRVLQGPEFELMNLLKSEPALNEPFYAPSTLEKLRTTGIIVPGVERQGANAVEVKPILMMHLEGFGLILLCLLFYLSEERIAYYGGKKVLAGADELLLYPFHNLALGTGDQLLGAVSNIFSLEDFIKTPAIGSFFKSSNRNPKVTTSGTLRLPARLNKVYDCKQSGMTTVPMVTRVVHGPGTQPTWPYDWSAGSSTSVFDEGQIRAMQEEANRPFPLHVWTAVADARASVLREGKFKDAPVPEADKCGLRPEEMPLDLYRTMCSDATTPAQQHDGGTSQFDDSQDTVQPLPPELVRRIEEAVTSSGGNLPSQEWDLPGVRDGAIILDTTEKLREHGFCVLNHVPSIKTKENQQALKAEDGGQGILFMDATALALKSAERLKTVTGFETGHPLYSKVFNRSIHSATADEAAAQQEHQAGGSEASSSGAEGQSRGAGQSDASGGSIPFNPLVAWLLVVQTFISSIGDKAWSVIFQNVNGTKVERSGDGLRAELKGDNWTMPEKQDGESLHSFHDRLAGFFALKYFIEALFEALSKILPTGSNYNSQLYATMYSLLASDGRKGNVAAQGPHTDIRPRQGFRRYSALINLSDLFSFLGFLVHSCPNIKAMFEFEEREFEPFQQQFLKTKSQSDPTKSLADFMGEATMAAKVRFAWKLNFAMNRPEQFRPMYSVYAKMLPITVALFDTDGVHWGPPFPMPGIEYPISTNLRVVHYRCLMTCVVLY